MTIASMTEPAPSLPPTDGGVLARHQAALDAGRFLIQRCGDCQRHVYFPREVCTHCGSDALEFAAPSGGGTVYSCTTVSRKAEDGGDYNVSLIDLDEGVRLMSRVTQLRADAVRIGQRVRARVEVTGGRGLVVFDPVTGEAP